MSGGGRRRKQRLRNDVPDALADQDRWPCMACGKMAYRSKRVARLVVKQLYPGEHLAPYRCVQQEQNWHIGHLYPGVRQGVLGREIMRGKS